MGDPDVSTGRMLDSWFGSTFLLGTFGITIVPLFRPDLVASGYILAAATVSGALISYLDLKTVRVTYEYPIQPFGGLAFVLFFSVAYSLRTFLEVGGLSAVVVSWIVAIAVSSIGVSLFRRSRPS